MATIVRDGIAFPRGLLPAGVSKGAGEPIPVDNYEEITFLIEYTRAAAGGGFVMNVEASNDKVSWYQVGEVQAAAIVPGTDVIVSTQRATLSYQATGPSTERITSPTFATTGHWMRILIGDLILNPGTGKVDYFLKGDN